MSDHEIRAIRLDEDEDFSNTQSYGQRIVTPVRFSTDPRDVGWVRENIPCQTACPADTNVPAYIRTIMEERYGRSYELNRLANVLPGVLGRICSRPCETACRHGWPGNGEPVAICHLKRAAGDHKQVGHRITENLYTPTGKKVAIVGAGPAGLAAAHDLTTLGHDVTIFEKEERPGGMLSYGIPEFRLPRDLLQLEIHNTIRLGVDLKTGVSIGSGPDDTPVTELLNAYDAVLLTTGCAAAIPLPLRTVDAGDDVSTHINNVENGLDFLMELHRGEQKEVGKRVAVVGAGFTALDCSRVAKRLGAEEVTIHIRTTEEYIPVTKEEIHEAKREGVIIHGLRTPVELLIDDAGVFKGVKFVQNRLGGWRSGGRRQAIPIDGSEFDEPCDTLLIAIGQKTVTDILDVQVDLDRWGNVRLGQDGMTSVPGLFSAGDFVNGASTVVEAVGHARNLSVKIDTWLMGRERRKKVVKISSVDEPLRQRSFDFIPRQEMPTEPLSERINTDNKEVETGYDSNLALEEAKRCYLCYHKYEIDIDNCTYCRACIEVAPRNCIKMVDGVELKGDGTYGSLHEASEWDKVGAIWIDNNECIRCGACFKVCPTKCISITRNEIFYQDL
ncbi:MAG: FAD-dependent oxidoreductase [Gammaproteobacteria bacterium]|nr:FAD-dependent oxidoreductase [Gammaproteobacteria bacterium]